MGNFKLSIEDRIALYELVKEEIDSDKEGKLERFTTNPELAELVGISINTIRSYLAEYFGELDLSYRAKTIQQQTGERNGQEAIKSGRGICGLTFEQRSKMGKTNAQSNKENKRGIFAISHEERVEIGKRSGQQAKENKTGIHSLTTEQHSNYGKIGGESNKENGTGFCGLTYEQRVEAGKKGGKTSKENGVGICGMEHKQYVEAGKMGGRKTKENGHGIFELTYEQRAETGRRSGVKSRERGTGLFGISKERRSEISKRNARKTYESFRHKAYFIDNRFYVSSQEEGTVALMLEKYLSDFSIQEGVNFQVKNRGINNGGIDFLIGEEFLEWHPTILALKKKEHNRGDILEEDFSMYQALLESLPEDKRKEFNENCKNYLGSIYQLSRQNAIDKSDYNGMNVALAKNIKGLYEFMSRHSTTLPEFSEFKSEFNKKMKYVKSCAVNKTKKDENKTPTSTSLESTLTA
jgi:hypothetical protein